MAGKAKADGGARLRFALGTPKLATAVRSDFAASTLSHALPSMTTDAKLVTLYTIDDEISSLERQLQDAKARKATDGQVTPERLVTCDDAMSASAHHFFLLLADSALPLGSFAFSSGLESYLAHSRPTSSFIDFLTLSLSSYASTTLPFVLAAHRHPNELVELDDCLDAAIMCTVGRRASVAQGRALLSIWDRSFKTALPGGSSATAVEGLKDFSTLLRSTSSNGPQVQNAPPVASAHLGPVFGAISGILGLSVRQTAYIFMLGHVKALLSAAVRASMFGPYRAQKLLASVEIQEGIRYSINQEWNTKVGDAGQSIPVMDLWIGRHELLYSRIFNS